MFSKMVEVNRGHQESPENSVEKAERFMAVVMQIIGGKLGLPLSNNFGEMTLQVRNECKRIGIPDEELDEMIADAMKEACTLSEFRVYGVSNHNSSQLSSLIMPRDVNNSSTILHNPLLYTTMLQIRSWKTLGVHR